jgi:hypothetical protein
MSSVCEWRTNGDETTETGGVTSVSILRTNKTTSKHNEISAAALHPRHALHACVSVTDRLVQLLPRACASASPTRAEMNQANEPMTRHEHRIDIQPRMDQHLRVPQTIFCSLQLPQHHSCDDCDFPHRSQIHGGGASKSFLIRPIAVVGCAAGAAAREEDAAARAPKAVAGFSSG